jgi:chromosome segregation protein
MASEAERRATIASADREITRFGDEMGRLRDERRGIESNVASSRARFGTGERELVALERDLEARAAAIAALDVQVQTDADRLDSLQTQFTELHGQVASDEARLHTIEELEHSLEGHVPGTRAVMEASSRSELNGVRGVVSQLLNVDERYAQALDAAFGNGLSHIVVETEADAERAIALLTQRELGRATFLPLDGLRARKGHELGARAGREGVIGYAHTLVTTQPQYAGIVAFLVGRTLVVETLATALALVREENFRDAIVTLAGERIEDGGAITGGRFTRERSILARAAQAETLRRTLPQQRARLEALEREIDESTASAESNTERREAARKAHGDMLVSVSDARTRLEALSAEIERLDAEVAGEHTREAAVQDQIDQARARKTALERTLESAGGLDEGAERKRLESALEHARELVTRNETEQQSAAATLSRAREEVSSAQAERDAAQARLAMLDQNAQRASDARSSTAREVQSLIEQQGAQEREVAALERAVVDADSAFTAARTERERLSDRGTVLDGEQRGAESEEREIAAHGEEARTRLAQIDAELGMLTAQFAQNPANEEELRDVESRYTQESDEVLDELPRLREELARLSANVNLNAESEREELSQRETFLREQMDDLSRARETLLATIREIENSTQAEFNITFEKVAAAFAEMFKRLFPGGEARMWQTEPERLSESGIEISVQPPGKKMTPLQSLSGGERAMTAVALIFALIATRPSPFYLLDEVDAALDEMNVDRFSAMVRDVAKDAQIVIVTHNKRTMDLAQRLYGVTMAEPGISSIVSVALDETPAVAAGEALPVPRESAIA